MWLTPIVEQEATKQIAVTERRDFLYCDPHGSLRRMAYRVRTRVNSLEWR